MLRGWIRELRRDARILSAGRLFGCLSSSAVLGARASVSVRTVSVARFRCRWRCLAAGAPSARYPPPKRSRGRFVRSYDCFCGFQVSLGWFACRLRHVLVGWRREHLVAAGCPVGSGGFGHAADGLRQQLVAVHARAGHPPKLRHADHHQLPNWALEDLPQRQENQQHDT